MDNLHWPTPLHLSPSERQAVAVALNKLKPADRQAVLNEAGVRCAAGGIRKPAAYLMGLIQRALKGDFRPWAGQTGPSPVAEPPSTAPSRPSRQQGEPASALAQACLNELRQLRSKRSGTSVDLMPVASNLLSSTVRSQKAEPAPTDTAIAILGKDATGVTRERLRN